uniref:Large ribosomal subunit protein bL12 C-terminal domain-containing protein n=2 Tax=Chaetoceros debilis TaxID=122233 RepID=A0A7S3QCY7_9STRA
MAFLSVISTTAKASSRILPRITRRSQHQIINSLPHSFHTSSYLNDSTSTSTSLSRVDEVFDKILQLNTLEVALLSSLVNEKMGFAPMTAAQQAAMAGGGSGGGGGAAAVEEVEEVKKTAFDLKLTGFDAKSKIKVIKEVRAMTGLGLKDAKEMVEGAPKTLKTGIKMEEAEELKAKIEAVGGTVEIS